MAHVCLIGVASGRREATDREIGSVARVRERQEALETQDALHGLWAESERRQKPSSQLARRDEELGGGVSQMYWLPWLHAAERFCDQEIGVASGTMPREDLLLEQPGRILCCGRFEKPFGERDRAASPEDVCADLQVDKFGTGRSEDPRGDPGMKPHANDGPTRSQSF